MSGFQQKILWNMQRKKEVWPMQRKKAQATETLSEGIEVKFKNDFKVTIINMLKKKLL